MPLIDKFEVSMFPAYRITLVNSIAAFFRVVRTTGRYT